MKAGTWLKRCIILFCALLLLFAFLTAWLDPFFHYHAPKQGFYYELKNERAQNDGIVKRFDYDALITGSSVTQNFKAGEMDALFDCHAVKTCFSGATFKELANLLDTAFAARRIRYVVCCATDVSNTFIQDKDYLQEGFDYPTYLYNENPFDDVNYLLNRDVLAEYILPMLARKITGTPGGVTDFDTYSAWSGQPYTYGDLPVHLLDTIDGDVRQEALTEDERRVIRENLEQNVIRIAREHPETTFCYFLPPYSYVYWGDVYGKGTAGKQIDAEAYAIGLLLPCENIRLYSFSTDTDITFDVSNYKDMTHYGAWINSLILKAMAEDDAKYRITRESADGYIEDMRELYLTPEHFNP
ncbi:MAG: hypothetical protein IJQ21_04170 [Lachnospiraceae bacterium]|nr:hypothetical protein [Lachnospiraceae bacterium]